jgi:hypothetical protein
MDTAEASKYPNSIGITTDDSPHRSCSSSINCKTQATTSVMTTLLGTEASKGPIPTPFTTSTSTDDKEPPGLIQASD